MKSIELGLCEVICDLCNGSGITKSHNYLPIICTKCNGFGKLT